MKDFIKKHQHQIVNIYLAINVIIWTGWKTYENLINNNLSFIEIGFALQNLVLIFIFLFRMDHKAVDKNIKNQTVALIAFFSGSLLLGQPATENKIVLEISKYVILCSNILGIFTLFNLGKSFGILIAYRKVVSNGLYSIVRHPMYGTDILLRIGFLISHFNWFTSTVIALSTMCYIYRAILEEKFLSEQGDYEIYKHKVKYRFIPYLF